MNGHVKKRNVVAEDRNFKNIMSSKYLYAEVFLLQFLLSRLPWFNEYNLSGHYAEKHTVKYRDCTEAERARISKNLFVRLEK